MSSHDLAERALNWAREHPLPNGHVVPLCLWGPRGVGKTAWITGYCNKYGYGLRGYQPSHDEDGTGLTGLAMINESTKKVEYAPPPFLPSRQMAGTALQEEKGIIFFDEINRGTVRARNSLMEPINEDRISKSGWSAPNGWVAVAAANPPEPGYDVEEMDEALMNRMCHFWIAFDRDGWSNWASKSKDPLPAGVVNFAYENSEMLATARSDLPDTLQIPITPRSMEFIGRLYVPGMERDLLTAYAVGLLGKKPGAAFMEHINEYEAREGVSTHLTVDHILDGEFSGPLAAELAAGNTERVQQTTVALAECLAEKSVESGLASNIAAFLRQLGKQLANYCVATLQRLAPHWTPVVQAAYRSAAGEPTALAVG